MFQLKKIDIATVALYSFLIFFILGIIIFIPFGLLGIFMSHLLSYGEWRHIAPHNFFPIFGSIFILVMPIFYGIIGMIVNIFITLIYNLLSIKLGGIKVQLEKIAIAEAQT